MEQAVTEACNKVPELAILAELPATENIHRMATGFRTAQEKATNAQWELNLQIAELRLKV